MLTEAEAPPQKKESGRRRPWELDEVEFVVPAGLLAGGLDLEARQTPNPRPSKHSTESKAQVQQPTPPPTPPPPFSKVCATRGVIWELHDRCLLLGTLRVSQETDVE